MKNIGILLGFGLMLAGLLAAGCGGPCHSFIAEYNKFVEATRRAVACKTDAACIGAALSDESAQCKITLETFKTESCPLGNGDTLNSTYVKTNCDKFITLANNLMCTIFTPRITALETLKSDALQCNDSKACLTKVIADFTATCADVARPLFKDVSCTFAGATETQTTISKRCGDTLAGLSAQASTASKP